MLKIQLCGHKEEENSKRHLVVIQTIKKCSVNKQEELPRAKPQAE